jgi:hypothetical protein
MFMYSSISTNKQLLYVLLAKAFFSTGVAAPSAGEAVAQISSRSGTLFLKADGTL